jgi:hypothetical protein
VCFAIHLRSYLLTDFAAIVEQVRDGTTLRARLLMPDGEHQIVNIALAGVRSARTSSKQGEASEPWGEEVGHTHSLPTCILHQIINTIIWAGQILHRITTSSTSCTRANTLSANLDRHAIPDWCNWHRTSTG